jgi:hypothetical protein
MLAMLDTPGGAPSVMQPLPGAAAISSFVAGK